jgi:UDP-N-acetyl-D-glucosamine dehydrogenase
MPHYVVERTAMALNAKKKALNGSRILLVGLAYKPNVDDMRESPTFVLMDLFKQRGAKVSYYDPHIPFIGMTREHAHWAGTKSVAWNKKTVAAYDVVLIATAHKAVDYKNLAGWSKCIVDTRNAMNGIKVADGQVWKA